MSDKIRIGSESLRLYNTVLGTVVTLLIAAGMTATYRAWHAIEDEDYEDDEEEGNK